jgi:hypothetical protein
VLCNLKKPIQLDYIQYIPLYEEEWKDSRRSCSLWGWAQHVQALCISLAEEEGKEGQGSKNHFCPLKNEHCQHGVLSRIWGAESQMCLFVFPMLGFISRISHMLGTCLPTELNSQPKDHGEIKLTVAIYGTTGGLHLCF